MSTFRTIDDLGPLLGQMAGKRVLVRADLNVPIADGAITDDSRIVAALPTIKALLERRARVLILAHFGRPGGEVVKEMSLAPIRGALETLLGEKVTMLAGCTDSAVGAQVDATDARVILLENTRFHGGESSNDAPLAADMAALGDAFVLDALSVAHRAHASVVGIATHLPSVAGLALAADLAALESALGNPDRPLAAIVGGAKVSTKLGVLLHLVDHVDDLIIGGAMANTFLHAQGKPVGASLCEPDMAKTALEIIERAGDKKCALHLPGDVVVASGLKAGAEARTVAVDAVADDDMILDIGAESVAALKEVIGRSKTLIWNGPLGAFEYTPFDAATNALASEAAKLTGQGKLKTIAGGGDTLAALKKAGASDDFSHVISAGGAFLEWMEGNELPGVAALKQD